MNIKRNHLSIIATLCSLLGLVLTTFIIQLSNAQISNWQSDISIAQNNANNIFLNMNNKAAQKNFYTIMQTTDLSRVKLSDPNRHFSGDSPEIDKLHHDFAEGNISPRDFLNERLDFAADEYHTLHEKYVSRVESIHQKLKNKPTIPHTSITWQTTSAVCNVIHVLTIAILFIIYFQLLRTLGQRYLTSIENKLQDAKNEIARLQNEKTQDT